VHVLLCSKALYLLLSNAAAQRRLIKYDSAYAECGYRALYDTTVLGPGAMVQLFYYINKWEIWPKSYVTLDSLAVYQHPNLMSEIQRHVDERGSNQYSRRLDQRRAQAVADYLTLKGIAPDRLMAKGYGEDSPVFERVDARNLSHEEKERMQQLNRRTTLKVLAIKP
jgi:outer membrane protein OmpA-like peptidoglycan-associated protein